VCIRQCKPLVHIAKCSYLKIIVHTWVLASVAGCDAFRSICTVHTTFALIEDCTVHCCRPWITCRRNCWCQGICSRPGSWCHTGYALSSRRQTLLCIPALASLPPPMNSIYSLLRYWALMVFRVAVTGAYRCDHNHRNGQCHEPSPATEVHLHSIKFI